MTPRYAGFWARFAAELVDSTILTIVSCALQLVLLGAYYWFLKLITTAAADGGDHISLLGMFNPLWMQVINAVLYALVALPYYVWYHYKTGTTLGKKKLKIYVVNAGDFKPITFNQSVIRCLGYAVSALPFCAGYLMVAFHPEKRSLHDILAGTVSIIRSENPSDAKA